MTECGGREDVYACDDLTNDTGFTPEESERIVAYCMHVERGVLRIKMGDSNIDLRQYESC